MSAARLPACHRFNRKSRITCLSPNRSYARLYYWARETKSSNAEVDYLMALHNQVFPVEVKAGKIGTLKSLQQFIKAYDPPLSLRISEQPLLLSERFLSIPLYLVGELKRFVGLALKQ